MQSVRKFNFKFLLMFVFT